MLSASPYMQYILVYSLSTGAIFLAHSLATLLALRFFTGLGLGGKWELGMTLISERIPAGFRGRAVAPGNIGWPLGTLPAAVFAFYLDPLLGWRATFVLAAFPALLVLWVRNCDRKLPHPHPHHGRRGHLQPGPRRQLGWAGVPSPT